MYDLSPHGNAAKAAALCVGTHFKKNFLSPHNRVGLPYISPLDHKFSKLNLQTFCALPNNALVRLLPHVDVRNMLRETAILQLPLILRIFFS